MAVQVCQEPHPYNYFMNINNSHQTLTYNSQTGSINIIGSNNTVYLNQCDVMLGIMGSQNRIIFNKCRAQVNLNGNNNSFTGQSVQIKVGFNGNSNSVKVEGQSKVETMYNNGLWNEVGNAPLAKSQSVASNKFNSHQNSVQQNQNPKLDFSVCTKLNPYERAQMTDAEKSRAQNEGQKQTLDPSLQN